MAGTRRGGERRAESDAFEAANPFLTRVDTKLEVVLIEEDEWEGDHPGIPAPLVTQDGLPVEFYSSGNGPSHPGLSTTYGIYTPIGDLMAEDGEEGSADISMSEYGFGVLGDGESEGPDSQDIVGFGVLDIEEPEDMGAYALNGGETLEFDIYNNMEYLDGPGVGGVSFEIDFVVLGGTGQVGVTLTDYYKGPKPPPGDFEGVLEFEAGSNVVEAMSGFLSEGDTGSLAATAMDGHFFDEGVIYVDGSIQVGIVGITVTTNFAGDLLEPS